MKLLSTNSKLLKLNGIEYLNVGLALAPNTLGGHKVCQDATPGCVSACVLWFTGRTVMQPIRDAMIARTNFLFNDPTAFDAQLCTELAAHERRAKRLGVMPTARLNVASDLDWSRIIAQFPGINFYDYTKVRSRVDLANYQVTYSWNERSTEADLLARIEGGRNVAMVFDTRYVPQRKIADPLPREYRGVEVIDGDVSDVRLRQFDGSGVIIGLRFKGSKARKAEAIR